MKVRSAVFAVAIAFVTISGACVSSESGGSCQNGTACGGSLAGIWKVTSSCLTVSGHLDPAWLGLDPRSCTSSTISGSLKVTGSWSALGDGTYADNTTTTGTPQLTLGAGCLILSGTMVDCGGIQRTIPGATCQSSSDGGCDCTLAVNQSGGIGLISQAPSTSGNYTTASNVVTVTTDSGNENYGYCVAGGQLTLTPQSATLPITGTIVLDRTGSVPGVGGMTGAGGATGTGGSATGTGGSATGAGGSGTGGRNGAGGGGGVTGVGGTTGSGGRGTGGSGAGGGAMGTGGSGTAGSTGHDGPCDIYAAAGTPCVVAFSTIRALTKTYTGPLYQVRSGSSNMNTGSGGTLKDIPQTADGFADTSVQDPFCSGTTCTIATLYDQSGNGNNLKAAPAGLTNGGTYAGMPDFESSATRTSLMVGGHKVYAIYMNAREGYRTPLNVKAKNVPMGNTAQGIYELADGTHTGTQCCWDFGSVSPDPTAYVTMNTLFFGTAFWGNGAGSGPWFMGDFEGGVWAGGSKVGDPGWGGLNDAHPSNPSNPSLKVPYALGILHTPVGKYALRMANIQTATDLTTAYDGNIPAGKTWGNAGGIVLGVGGDNSNNSFGTFYEGAVTNGSPSNATDLAVMQNIQAAGYGK